MAGKNTCSFCGRDENQVGKLITSKFGGKICRNCSDLCRELFKENYEEDFTSEIDLKKPK